MTRPLTAFFDPRSVAVVGASAVPGKWGHEYSRQLLSARDRRRIFLVNARREPVLGEPTFAALSDLPEAPDLAVVCVPAAHVEAVVAEGIARGVRHFVCVTAGFAETGEAGRAAEARLLDLLRGAGARMVGPNCVGLFDAAATLHCTAFWDLPGGDVGVISQSGGVIVELGIRLPRIGLGISRAVSVGNQADLSAADFVAVFADDPHTRLVAAYIEDFRDGRALFAAVDAARARSKEVILVAPEQSAAVGRAMNSHTGSLISDEDVVAAACEDAGVVRVRSIADLMLAIRGLSAPHRSAGRRVAVLADGGGSATLGTDAATAEGLEVPPFSAATAEAIRAAATPGSGVGNPVDLVGALDLAVFGPVVEAIAASGEVDAILLNGAFNAVGDVDPAREAAVAGALAASAERHGVALAVASMLPEEPAMHALSSARIPVFDYPTEAARALAVAAVRPRRRAVPALPPLRHASVAAGYFCAREALAAYGVPFAPAREVRSREEAASAAVAVGYPVALKALGTSHKSDAGGVVLGIAAEADLLAHVDALAARLAPPSFSVEAMVRASGGVELLVGGLRDRTFGPTVAVAAGGTFTELLRDRVVALAPVDAPSALAMIARLKIAPRLDGYRGASPADREALASAIVAVSRFIAAHPAIAEVEVNPIIVHAGGAVAVDARVGLVATASGGETS